MAFARGKGSFAVAETDPKKVEAAARALSDAERKLGEAVRHLDTGSTQPLSKDALALKDWTGYLLRDLTEFTCE